MSNLTLISLPASACAYAEDVLEGCAGLCARVLPQLTSSGQISAILPQGVSMTLAESYKGGRIASGNETKQWLIERINAFGRAQPGVLIIQDIWFGPNDLKYNPWRADMWADGDELYVWSETGEGRDPEVSRCLFSPRSFYWIGFLVADPGAASKLHAGSASIEELASKVVESYIPAYDDESYLIWSPDAAGV
jgi:hypothetical protein